MTGQDGRLTAVHFPDSSQRPIGDLRQEVVVGFAAEDVPLVVLLEGIGLAGLP